MQNYYEKTDWARACVSKKRRLRLDIASVRILTILCRVWAMHYCTALVQRTTILVFSRVVLPSDTVTMYIPFSNREVSIVVLVVPGSMFRVITV